MLNRRSMLQSSGLMALAPSVPAFLHRAAQAAVDGRKSEHKLVVIQLDGGNDGINTVVPYTDPGYARNRQKLGLSENRLLKINDKLGLHPSLQGAADLLNDGQLAIVQGVGYPNPNRSHFRSMAIWHSARLDESQHSGYGWAGRALDQRRRGGGADAIFIGEQKVPLALRGRRSVATSMVNTKDLKLALPATGAALPQDSAASTSSVQDFVQRAVINAYATSGQVAQAGRRGNGSASYPNTGLSRRLQLISRLIKAELPATVYYTTQSGYDTHSVQSQIHSRLLRTFAGGLKAFVSDLKAAGLLDRVTVLAFSEFGRRVRENGSIGTDHGTAGPVFLAGSKVQAGVHGTTPSLTDLKDGDLKTHVDFRTVYYDLLANWLKLPATDAVGQEFKPQRSLFGKPQKKNS